ncbi:hypothetical protein HK096_009339, partial [Nowakowskiella sp. JEL0078]
MQQTNSLILKVVMFFEINLATVDHLADTLYDSDISDVFADSQNHNSYSFNHSSVVSDGEVDDVEETDKSFENIFDDAGEIFGFKKYTEFPVNQGIAEDVLPDSQLTHISQVKQSNSISLTPPKTRANCNLQPTLSQSRIEEIKSRNQIKMREKEIHKVVSLSQEETLDGVSKRRSKSKIINLPRNKTMINDFSSQIRTTRTDLFKIKSPGSLVQPVSKIHPMVPKPVTLNQAHSRVEVKRSLAVMEISHGIEVTRKAVELVAKKRKEATQPQQRNETILLEDSREKKVDKREKRMPIDKQKQKGRKLLDKLR